MPAAHPEELIDLFSRYLTAGDLVGAVQLYESNALYIQQGREIRDSLAIREVLQALISRRPTMTGSPQRIHQVDDIALVFNRWRFEFNKPDGTPDERHGISAVVSRRQPDGTWRVLIDDPWGGQSHEEE